MTQRVAVLGAGIQGACAAAELAGRGFKVDLYDQAPACMTGASFNNEGKIHLGYVYANDPSRRTARAMVRGALNFAPLMRRWFGPAVDAVPKSTPFLYVVHATSLVGVEAMQGHFDDCVAIAAEIGDRGPIDYFGRDVREPVRALPRAVWQPDFDPRDVQAVFGTQEIAVDAEAMAVVVRAQIATIPGIDVRLDTRVVGVARSGGALAVTGVAGGHRDSVGYDHVVNATWDGRLAIDATLGLAPQRRWLWRKRHNLRIEGCDRDLTLPSVTAVLGAFGDVVNFGAGTVYLTWYPSGRVGISRDLEPQAWRAPEGPADRGPTEAGIVAGLSGIVPQVAQVARGAGARLRLTEGVVFAWGESDIHLADSQLHERFAIGVHSHGRYHSIDTGKYTTAPIFAVEVADRIVAAGPP